MDSGKLASVILERECDCLILAIDRLTKDLGMQQSRLKNVKDLVCSLCSENVDITSRIQVVYSLNISGTRATRALNLATLRDSAAVSVFFTLLPPPPSNMASDYFSYQMKQVAYLGMVFLPPTFMTVNHSLVVHTNHCNKMTKSFFKKRAYSG